MIKLCENCSREFKTAPCKIKCGKGKFCSVECYRKSMIGKKQSDKTKKKRSLSLTGRTQSISERIAKSVAMKNKDWGERVSEKNELIRKGIEIRLWREAVFARDNYTCQKCKKRGARLNAHHKNNFSEYPELRTAIDNGITLCEKCHIAFHKRYGKKTTAEQIEGNLTLF